MSALGENVVNQLADEYADRRIAQMENSKIKGVVKVSKAANLGGWLRAVIWLAFHAGYRAAKREARHAAD